MRSFLSRRLLRRERKRVQKTPENKPVILGIISKNRPLGRFLVFAALNSVSLYAEAGLDLLYHILDVPVTFHQEVVCARFGRLRDLLRIVDVREEDDGGILPPVGVLAQFPEHSESVHDRHHEVEQNKVRMFFERDVQSFLTIARLKNSEALEAQNIPDGIAERRFVFDDEHFFIQGVGHTGWRNTSSLFSRARIRYR